MTTTTSQADRLYSEMQMVLDLCDLPAKQYCATLNKAAEIYQLQNYIISTSQNYGFISITDYQLL